MIVLNANNAGIGWVVMHIQYLREFPEYCVKRVRRATKISHIAVLTFDVGAELLVECLGVREVPLYGAYH